MRDTPYPASEQASHPYSIGVTEIAPAADAVFTSDENINIVFQVINPQPSERGKPDVEIASRIVRLTGIKAEPIASLKPLTYSADTMPAPFDLRLGHPVFVALTAPLETLGRGSYRLEIIVNDRNAGRSATSDVELHGGRHGEVAARAKPRRSDVAFAKESVLQPECADLRGAVVDAVIAVAGAAARAGERRGGQVRRSDGRGTGRERRRGGPCRADRPCSTSRSATRHRRCSFSAPSCSAPRSAPARLLSGAARALQGRDADAIAAWREALTAGRPATWWLRFCLTRMCGGVTIRPRPR